MRIWWPWRLKMTLSFTLLTTISLAFQGFEFCPLQQRKLTDGRAVAEVQSPCHLKNLISRMPVLMAKNLEGGGR